LTSAELIDGICQRYGCLPSELLKEDVSLLRNLQLVELGKEEK
tara:strand:- start:4073 stop:4201 length:129 start_codon:yes stop_codon:yes gene_type:complete